MLGDFTPGKTIVFDFNTHKADGTPITLAGTPAVSVYKNSTTESTAGVTLTVDYDSRTGMHHVVIDTSTDGTFYAAANDFRAVITAGTVDSISVVGTVIGAFSLSNRSALRPATADRTLVVDAAGLADATTVKLGPSGSGTAQTARDIGASVLLSSGTGTGQLSITSGVVSANATQIAGAAVNTSTAQLGVNVVNAGGTAWGSGAITRAAFSADSGMQTARSNTAQAGASGSITLDASASATTDFYKGSVVYLTGGTGANQSGRLITAYNGTTKVATITPAWATNPDATSTFAVMESGSVNLVAVGGTAGTVIPTVTTVTNQLTAAQIATGVWQDTTAGDFTVASSIGKSLYTSGNAPGAASGIALVGSNMGTISGGTITTVSDKTGYSLASGGLAAVTAWTVNVTGSLSGSVGSVTGAVGSVTGNVGGNVTGSVGSVVGAVGSVTGNVGGNVTGSVGSIATGGIVAGSFALDSITSTALAASAVSEIQSGLMTSAGYTAPPSAATISTQVQTDLGTGSALTALATQSSVNTLTGYVDTEVAAILAAVATTGVVLSAAQMNKIADHVLRRQMANVEASSSGDTLSLGSQYGAIQQIQESALVGTTLTVNKTDGTTALGTKTVATASGADAITGIS